MSAPSATAADCRVRWQILMVAYSTPDGAVASICRIVLNGIRPGDPDDARFWDAEDLGYTARVTAADGHQAYDRTEYLLQVMADGKWVTAREQFRPQAEPDELCVHGRIYCIRGCHSTDDYGLTEDYGARMRRGLCLV